MGNSSSTSTSRSQQIRNTPSGPSYHPRQTYSSVSQGYHAQNLSNQQQVICQTGTHSPAYSGYTKPAPTIRSQPLTNSRPVQQAPVVQNHVNNQQQIRQTNTTNLPKIQKNHQVIQIQEGAIGYDYEKLFSNLLDAAIWHVAVEDPYIKSHHQIYNFLRFCELLIKKCKNLEMITLITGIAGQGDDKQQKDKLNKISDSLKTRGVHLDIEFSSNLHDREIRFSNGWIFKIGRGLDIYKPPLSNFSIGACDFSLRPCHRTTINIFHQQHTTGI